MKKEIKGFVIGSIVTFILTATVGFATGTFKTVDMYENNVSIYANGNYVDSPNFTYNDTTYVPLRAVLELMDCNIDYDDSSKTVNAKNNYSSSSLSYGLPVYVSLWPLHLPLDQEYIAINDTLQYNGKTYVSVPDIANAMDCRIRYNSTNISLANRLHYDTHLYGAIGDIPNAYPMIRYSTGDDPNSSANDKQYIDVEALTDAGFDLSIHNSGDDTIWVYDSPLTTRKTSKSSNSSTSSKTQQKSNANNYQQELATINAKYDAMIEATRSQYAGQTSSMSITIMAQQIQQYEQQRQNEIDILNAKYGY